MTGKLDENTAVGKFLGVYDIRYAAIEQKNRINVRVQLVLQYQKMNYIVNVARHPRSQRHIVLNRSIEQFKKHPMQSICTPNLNPFSFGVDEIFLRETRSAVQLACSCSLSSIETTGEILLWRYIARADDHVVEIYDSSTAVGVVRY